MHDLLIISVMFLACILGGGLLSRIGMPRITACVGVGIAFSPELLGGRLGLDVSAWSGLATAIALGLIAYLIERRAVGGPRAAARPEGGATPRFHGPTQCEGRTHNPNWVLATLPRCLHFLRCSNLCRGTGERGVFLQRAPRRAWGMM